MNKPTVQEKDQSIEQILSEGLQQPEGIGAFFIRMFHTLGFKYIFYDLQQVSGLLIILALGAIIFLALNIHIYKFATIFLLSPLSFVLVISVTEWIEQSNPLYELKMTFKHTVKDMVIFRTLCYSLMSTVLSVILSVGMTNALESLRAISIAFSALFLCTLFTVAIKRRFNHRITFLASFGVWIVVNLMPLLILGSSWETFLAQIPLGITLTVSTALIYLYMKALKQFINMKQGEVGYDATS